MTILQFLQSLSNYLGLITLVVGLSAIYLYLKQKEDRKRDAARLILQEIRYAEQQIRDSGRGTRGYMLASKMLPTNSWNDNIHLFTKDLKETEIDTISRFYSQTAYVDSLIAERSKQKLHPTMLVQVPPMSTPPPVSTTPQLAGGITQQIPIQTVQVPNPAEEITNNLLREVSSAIEFLYNTPSVEKLRQISERKWYQIV
jgi:hypothetical protein